MAAKQTFQARIVEGRGGGAFVDVPFDVPTVFGSRRLVRVKGTIDGYPFASSIAPMGAGAYLLGLHKATREAICKSIGDSVDPVIQADTTDRVVTVPDDLKRALDSLAAANKT